ncbi:MAG: STAS domain-containing protein [bacterium]
MNSVFTLSTLKKDDYAVIYTNGYLNDLGGEKIDEECSRLLEEGNKKIIINFKNSKIINSIGISILIGVIEKIQEKQGKLGFCNLTPVNKETFKMMGLTKFATSFELEEDAIKGLCL